ncbi:MAG TPA: DUF3822 family protein [Bacteroidales bacterium]|nr:DUF3822 family protein [Bacteroidales bacterium]
MPFLELFDETLDINSNENYELSIQLSPEELSFCLLDTIRNKFILIRSYEADENKYFNADKINELLTKDDFLKRSYKKVNIVMPSPKFTLVPTPLFDPGKKDEYFTFNHTNEEDNTIITNKINDPDVFIVFSVSKPFNDIINNYYPGVHPFHHIKPLFDHISHSRKSVNGNYIHIYVEREFFNLIIFSNNVLKFCNSFDYRNISDILYFVLNVFKKLDINQEETVYFSGLTEKYDDLFSNFSIYIRNIKFAGPSGNFTFSYVFNDTYLHRFINLFSIVNCE